MQGFLPTLLEDVPDMAVKFAVYESLRPLHRRLCRGRQVSGLTQEPPTPTAPAPGCTWKAASPFWTFCCLLLMSKYRNMP